MTRNDARISSSSNESWKSTDTIKGLATGFETTMFGESSTPAHQTAEGDGDRMKIRDEVPKDTSTSFLDDYQLSPTSTSTIAFTGESRNPQSAFANASAPNRGMSDFGSRFRRDMSALEMPNSSKRVPKIQHTLSSSASPNYVAPWMSAGTASPAQPSSAVGTSFYYDSGDALSPGSQLSSGNHHPNSARMAGSFIDSPDTGYFQDERRPSVASVQTASSSGSKASSLVRNGKQNYKKLQGFFGEDRPGEHDSDAPSGQERRSHSYSRHRDRTRSSVSTDATARDSSPRPHTPAPSSDVVPFLYQDSEDIGVYGEAPVRNTMLGPDRGRYQKENSNQVSTKTAPSNSSSQSRKGLLGRGHKHNKSNEDPKLTARPTLTRGDSTNSATKLATLNRQTSLTASNLGAPRSKSPGASSASMSGPTKESPVQGHKSRGVLNMFRRHKDKDDVANLKSLPGSVRSLNIPPQPQPPQQLPPLSRTGTNTGHLDEISPWAREGSIAESQAPVMESQGAPRSYDRERDVKSAGFRPFTKFKRKPTMTRQSDYDEGPLGPMDRKPSLPRKSPVAAGEFDTNKIFDLSNMGDIISSDAPMTTDDIFVGPGDEEGVLPEAGPGMLGWNAPDSWAVKKVSDENVDGLPEIDEEGIPPKADENATPYCIRIFKSDGTFSTLLMPLHATVTEVINQLSRKIHSNDSITNYQIIMKKHDLQRILGHGERPVNIQKKLLEQAGYNDSDKIEDVGREDNSYLCRFLFVPARESGYAAQQQDSGFSKLAKFSHIDLSGRNLITIPIALYSKASEIVSLNLSRNLSLDVPMDFIQSCLNLREIKFNNNEALSLPKSISAANRLTVLDVSNNRLEQLQHLELYRLQTLISFKLANNRLINLPPYFERFSNLRTLNVSSNFLEEFPTFLCHLQGLVDLDMSFNAIAALPKEIGLLSSLERFVITNNRLSGALPDEFGQLYNLKEVDIRYNALSSIDIIASLPSVEQVSADHNSVSVFEGSFEKIRILRLNSNPVTKFELINPTPTLTTLILSNAKLATIPDAAFERMPNLVKLVLEKNHFVSLPSHIGKLRHLEHFSIARNSLNSLPPEIGCLTELRDLDVRQNNLKKLPAELWYANKLETLNISSNVLESFPKPGSKQPQVPGEMVTDKASTGTPMRSPSLSHSQSYEELGPLEAFGQRRPSQASGGLLSVGSSPVPGGPDRKPSVVSVYGKGGRNTSVVSRNASQSTISTMTPPTRKDSSLAAKLVNTFAGTLRNLYMADNQLDDEVFDEITMLAELRVLNLSYNEINEVPPRSLRSWPQLIELYLSGNELTSLPSDDFESHSQVQVLHLNGNKFQTLPAEFGKAKGLAVLDCGSNLLKYNVSNWPYDWNWNYNPALKYLNLSGNKRLEIKPNLVGPGAAQREERSLTDFSSLQSLRILGLMDVTLTIPTIPDETEDRRVRTSGSLAGSLAYGMADSLGRSEHLSIIDMVVPRFNSSESETLLGLFDGQNLSSGGSKIAKYLHENFGSTFVNALRTLNTAENETPEDALRRAFLSLNKDLATAATALTDERSLLSHRGSAAPAVLSKEDLNSGGVATVMYLKQMELYVANVGDAQALLVHSDGGHHVLTRKHDPAEPTERQRIRDAGGWVSRQGKLNDILEVSRAFGYVQLMPAVQASPHILRVSLKETDEMIILASREVWEYLPFDLAVDIARSERPDLMRAAQKVRDLAMAYGATNKIMVMVLGISDLKKRGARIRPSMSMGPSGILDDSYVNTRKIKRGKGEAVEDSMLRRLEAEVSAPVGDISIVFTDIKSSTQLWEKEQIAMRTAIRQHNEVMRRQLRLIGGYEVKTEGDAFIVSFPTATSALLWCFAVQNELLNCAWPDQILAAPVGRVVHDSDHNLIYRGLSVRMGIHFGAPVCEIDPVTRRMDYFGPMVNKAARISSVADGGQITVSQDFIGEIQRCLETYSESDRSSSTGSEDTFADDIVSQNIRRELRVLSTQGFEVKDMGERKLKGLENPEFIYLMYPHNLSGRIDVAPGLQIDPPPEEEPADKAKGKAAAPILDETLALQFNTELGITTEMIWSLWTISLRLEMICDKLEIKGGDLSAPDYGMMEKMKTTAGEVSEGSLLNFLRHLTTRIEASIALISTRNILLASHALPSEFPTINPNNAIPHPETFLDTLSGSLESILQQMRDQQEELKAYRARYGEIMPERINAKKAIEAGVVDLRRSVDGASDHRMSRIVEIEDDEGRHRSMEVREINQDELGKGGRGGGGWEKYMLFSIESSGSHARL